MITAAQIKKKAERKYWHIIKELIKGESPFPLTIPADKSLPGSFELLNTAISQLLRHSKEKTGYGYCLTFKGRRTREYGVQSLPTRIFFESPGDYLKYIGKIREASRILSQAEKIVQMFPVLKQWLEKNPKKILKYQDDWEDICKVLYYFSEHPRPGMYIRELPIDVHTKFVEEHKSILREMLELIIPDHINHEAATFEQRFYLKTPEPGIRIRRLDNHIDKEIFSHSDELTLPAGSFTSLESECRYVIIVENQVTFLNLPELSETIAIYGGGYQVEILKLISWLKDKTIVYWGDIDVHGFEILSVFRRHFPSAISIMMDMETFHFFKDRHGKGTLQKRKNENALNLSPSEFECYRFLKQGNYRLEQEQISLDYMSSQFKKLLKALSQ